MIFGELDYRLSVVKRWGVVQTIRTQSVAEHSYNVAIIAERIAARMFPNGLVPNRHWPILGELLHAALHHDRFESIMGDPPSYMKAFIDEAGATQKIGAAIDDEDIQTVVGDSAIRFIIKCADYVDACVFLGMEMSLGNKSVEHHLRRLENRFCSYAKVAADDGFPNIYNWYVEDVAHKMFGGNGQYVSEIDGFPKTP